MLIAIEKLKYIEVFNVHLTSKTHKNTMCIKMVHIWPLIDVDL